MIPINYAHVKEFETVYKRGDPNNGVNWVKVTLQIVVLNRQEAEEVCSKLTKHIEKPLPRYLSLVELEQ